MTATHFAGPVIAFGSLQNVQGTGGSGTGGSNPEAGPSAAFMGQCFLDPRVTYQPGITGPGKIFGFLGSPYVLMTDGTPAAAGAGKVAAAQTATSGTGMTLASAIVAGIQPNAPVVPSGQTMKASNVVTGVGLDFGFATCSTTAGSTTITAISRMSILAPGVTVIVGAGTGATCQAATVLSVSGTSATLDTPMGVTATGIALALANGARQNIQTVPPVSFWPWMSVGSMAVFDATQGIARTLSVTSNNAGDTGWTVAVSGYDVFLNPMHETITVVANAIAYGSKAWKFVVSATPLKAGGGVSAGTISVGTTDVFGFNVREDYWEISEVFWNGAYLTASTGWTAADATSPATATTHDVRGVMQLSAVGPGTGATAKASDGATRLAIWQSVHPYALLAATPQNPAPLFGVTQF